MSRTGTTITLCKETADEMLKEATRMAYDNSDGTAPTDFMILNCLYRMLCGDEPPALN